MNATKRIIGLSLGVGLVIASGSAFAHHYPTERGLPIQGLLDYDYDGDRVVSRDEFEQRELYTCRQAFLRNDPNNDAWITQAERENAVGTYCEGWYTARGNGGLEQYRGASYRHPERQLVRWNRPRVVRPIREGFGWSDLRSESLVQIRRIFVRSDRDRNGVLDTGELNRYATEMKRISAERIAAAKHEAECHVESHRHAERQFAYYRRDR